MNLLLKVVTVFALFSLTCFGNSTLLAEETEFDVKEIIKKVDELYRANSSYAEMEMMIVTPHYERTMKMKAWTKGMKHTFIRILEPKKDRGIATLRMENEMWNYFPKIDKVMKVPPSMMMGSWMGSDFTNDDLVKESTLLDDYNFSLHKTDSPAIYTVILTPKDQTATVWGKIVLTVNKETYLPLTEEYYDENGKKMRILEFTDIKELGGRTMPATMEMVPLNKEGHKTTIRYLDAEFNVELDNDVFTLRNLQKVM